MSKRIKLGIAAGIAAIIIVIFVIISFVTGSRADSPEYAIKIIAESIVNHDQVKFNSIVDVDNLLSSSYDGFVEGMISSDRAMPEEVKDHVVEFTQMLKVPMTSTLKSAINNYVATGNFEDSGQDDKAKTNKDESVPIPVDILERMGLNKLQFRQLDGITINANNKSEAIAKIRVYQNEVTKDFTFEVVMKKSDTGEWHVVDIKNFREFIEMLNQTRHEQLKEYLEETESIITRHDKTIKDAEQKYSSILSSGRLGQDNTRNNLKNLMIDVIKKDWEVRKQELFNVKIPKDAEALQNLRIKICDLSIESAELYAKWMDDKNAATIKEADNKRKQVQTLFDEEKLLVARMSK